MCGAAVAAHEDVDRGVAALGPGVDRDVRFGQHRDPRYAAARGELRAGAGAAASRRPPRPRAGARARSRRRRRGIGVPEIDDQMAAGVAQTVALDEVIVGQDSCALARPGFPPGLRPGLRHPSRWFRRPPQFGQGVPCHRSPPQTSSAPERLERSDMSFYHAFARASCQFLAQAQSGPEAIRAPGTTVR